MFTGTYFIWEEGSERYSLDIVSLTSTDSALFNSYNGILVVGDYYEALAPEYPDGSTPANYNQKGRDWERAASVEFFDEDGQLEHNQGIGLRVTGKFSRFYNKKSLKLYARDGYGNDSIDYEVFEGLEDDSANPVDEFSELLVRIGGNDYDHAIIRDLLGQNIAPDSLDIQASEPKILFLNGEYYGIYNIRENMNDNYLANHYNVN